jgi:hypothetical protein
MFSYLYPDWPMLTLKFKYSLLVVIFFLFDSCGIIIPSKNEPKAKFCYFAMKDASINYKGTEEGILRIEIELGTSENKYVSKYFQQNFEKPIRKIDLSKMDTSLLKKNYVAIKIWDKSLVIEDFNIYIKPLDWHKSKIIYSRYSLR